MFAIIYKLDAVSILLVSSRYQLLKAKLIEVHLKILDEIGLSCVIAVAVDYFAFEVFFIMS